VVDVAGKITMYNAQLIKAVAVLMGKVTRLVLRYFILIDS